MHKLHDFFSKILEVECCFLIKNKAFGANWQPYNIMIFQTLAQEAQFHTMNKATTGCSEYFLFTD